MRNLSGWGVGVIGLVLSMAACGDDGGADPGCASGTVSVSSLDIPNAGSDSFDVLMQVDGQRGLDLGVEGPLTAEFTGGVTQLVPLPADYPVPVTVTCDAAGGSGSVKVRAVTDLSSIEFESILCAETVEVTCAAPAAGSGIAADPVDDCHSSSDEGTTLDCDGDHDLVKGTATCTDTHLVVTLETDEPFPETAPDSAVRRAGITIGDAEVASAWIGMTAILRAGQDAWENEFEAKDQSGTEIALGPEEGVKWVGGTLEFSIELAKVSFTATHASASTRISNGPGTTVIDKIHAWAWDASCL